jgi:DNA primase
MSYLDFDKVKADVSIEQAVDMLGLTLTKRGDQYRGVCPICEGSKERDLVVTPGRNVFYCFRAKTGGDQIGLVSHIKGLPVKEAAQFLAGDVPKEKPKAKEQPSEGGFKALDYLQHDHEAVIALGFEPDVAQALGLGFAPRGILKGTVAVPLRSRDGTIAGYIGLTDVERLPPKWQLP